MTSKDSKRWQELLFLKSCEQFGYWLSKEEEKEYHRIGKLVSNTDE
jgi:hypothetical protein